MALGSCSRGAPTLGEAGPPRSARRTLSEPTRGGGDQRSANGRGAHAVLSPSACGQETRKRPGATRIQPARMPDRASRSPLSVFRLLLDALVDRRRSDASLRVELLVLRPPTARPRAPGRVATLACAVKKLPNGGGGRPEFGRSVSTATAFLAPSLLRLPTAPEGDRRAARAARQGAGIAPIVEGVDENRCPLSRLAPTTRPPGSWRSAPASNQGKK